MTYFFISRNGTPTKLDHCIITAGTRMRSSVQTSDGIHYIEGAKEADIFELSIPYDIELVDAFRIADETGTVYHASLLNVLTLSRRFLINGLITGSEDPPDRAKAQQELRRISDGRNPNEYQC